MPHQSFVAGLAEGKDAVPVPKTAEYVVAQRKVQTAIRFLLSVCLSNGGCHLGGLELASVPFARQGSRNGQPCSNFVVTGSSINQTG